MSIRTGTLSCVSFLLQRIDGPDSKHFLRLFKSMIFALIENHTFPEIKIQIVSLLQDTLHSTQLPIDLLLVPFLRYSPHTYVFGKWMNTNSSIIMYFDEFSELQYHGYDNIDFNLLSEISRHASLSKYFQSQRKFLSNSHNMIEASDCIELASFLGSICIQDEVFGRVARVPLLVLVHRFSKDVTWYLCYLNANSPS
jgi:hypothetical protein